jgi:hypothetical protein
MRQLLIGVLGVVTLLGVPVSSYHNTQYSGLLRSREVADYRKMPLQ